MWRLVRPQQAWLLKSDAILSEIKNSSEFKSKIYKNDVNIHVNTDMFHVEISKTTTSMAIEI